MSELIETLNTVSSGRLFFYACVFIIALFIICAALVDIAAAICKRN